MPAPYGITDTGFSLKTFEEAVDEFEEDYRADFGEGVLLSASSVHGRHIKIMSERIAELWEALQAGYTATTRDGATGVALDYVNGLTGTPRAPPARSTVAAVATGTPGTVLPVGRIVSVTTSGVRFRTTAQVTIGGGGTIPVNLESEEYGAFAAPAGTLTVIDTPVSGWASITNALDADLGQAEETDADYRTRAEAELRGAGKAAVDAIAAHVRKVDDTDILQVSVFQNVTMSTNADGLPPKSVEVVVRVRTGVDLDTEIIQAVFEATSGGIETYGTTTETVTDSEGKPQDISFSHHTDLPVYIVVNLQVTAAFPADGATQVEDALVAYGDTVLTMGQDLVTSKLFKVVEDAASGIYDIADIFIGTAPAPATDANVLVDPREVASIDSSRITVNVSVVTP